MAEEINRIEVLESELKSINDTDKNLAGLIQKLARTQAALSDAGLEKFSESLAEPFAALSGIVETLQKLAHDMEIERNRIRNEAR